MFKTASFKKARETKTLSLLFLLVSLTFFTRLPFQSHTLFHWDSVQFALALHHFDIRVHQPHPPGYFFYILLGRIALLLSSTPHAALLAVSLLFSCLAVALFFLAALQLGISERAAFSASCIYLFSPLLWFHGEVAFSYVLESFALTLLFLFGMRFLKTGAALDLTLATATLAFAGGIRQDMLLFGSPLWVYFLLKAPSFSFRLLAKELLFFSLLTLTWFVPTLLFSGGSGGYQQTLATQLTRVVLRNLSLKELLLRSGLMLNYLFQGLTLALFPLFAYFYYRFRKGAPKTLSPLAYWILPSFGFYLFVHLTNPGYLLTLLPACYLLLARWLEKVPAKLCSPLALLLALSNASFFLFSPLDASYHAIRDHDKKLHLLLTAIAKFPPQESALLTANYFFFGFRHASYYLPEYPLYLTYPEPAFQQKKKTWHRLLNRPFPPLTYLILFMDPSLPASSLLSELASTPRAAQDLAAHFQKREEKLGSEVVLTWFQRVKASSPESSQAPPSPARGHNQ